MGNSKTVERLAAIETDLHGFRELMTERAKTGDERHAEIIKRLDEITKNGKGVAKITDVAEAIVSHATSCPGRVRNGLAEQIKGNWKLIGALITIVTTLSGALAVALNMLKPFLPGG